MLLFYLSLKVGVPFFHGWDKIWDGNSELFDLTKFDYVVLGWICYVPRVHLKTISYNTH